MKMKFLPLTFLVFAIVLIQFVSGTSAVKMRILVPPRENDSTKQNLNNACSEIQAKYIKEASDSVPDMGKQTIHHLAKRDPESPPSEVEISFLGNFNGKERTDIINDRIRNVAEAFAAIKFITSISLDPQTVTITCDNKLTDGAHVTQITKDEKSTTVISLGQLFFGTNELISSSRRPAGRISDEEKHYNTLKNHFIEPFTKQQKTPPAFYGFVRPTNPGKMSYLSEITKMMRKTTESLAAVLIGASQLVPAIIGKSSLVLSGDKGGIIAPAHSNPSVAALARQAKKTSDSIMVLTFLAIADPSRFNIPRKSPSSALKKIPSPAAKPLKSALKQPNSSSKPRKKVKISGKITVHQIRRRKPEKEDHSHFSRRGPNAPKIRSVDIKAGSPMVFRMLKKRQDLGMEK